MEIVILDSEAHVADVAADTIERLAQHKPEANIGLATGSSPVSTYNELVCRHIQRGRSIYDSIDWFLLDEYTGLDPDHPQSYMCTVRSDLTDRLGVPHARVHGPDGRIDGLPTAGARYESEIDAEGGIDLQLLGIGTDGHIAFNEPGSSFGSLTRLKTLTGQTRADNARFFESPAAVPRHVLTQGLATISRAEHLLLIACGPSKAEPVAAAVEGPVTASFPGSALQLHPHATLLVDRAAAALLARRDYYKETWARKPAWQPL